MNGAEPERSQRKTGSATDSGSSRHVSYDQVKAMLDFMGQHAEFASGTLRSLEARHASKRLWAQLAKTLNSKGGTKKTGIGWSRYWSDFKNKLKKRVISIKLAKGSGSTSSGVRQLTKLERHAYAILGPYFTKTISKATVNGDGRDTHHPPQVKVECVYSENAIDGSERLSEGDESVSSEGSSNDESDINIDEAVVQNLYPKWLIEVEKKRAEAELTRARAEQQRASVAAKTADATLIQAQALKRLSEAAVTQADALMRIAVALETREHRDMLNI